MQLTQKLATSNNIYFCAVNWPKIVHTKIAEENIMKIKKILVMMLTVVMLTSALAVPASAASNNCKDVNFTIKLQDSNIHASTETYARVKKDSSSSYINYTTRIDKTAASGPYQFEAIIYGSKTAYGTYVDCTSFKLNGERRRKAIVTRGSRGLFYQTVYENFGLDSYGQIWGRRFNSSNSGIARGSWSVDSAGNYPHYN